MFVSDFKFKVARNYFLQRVSYGFWYIVCTEHWAASVFRLNNVFLAFVWFILSAICHCGCGQFFKIDHSHTPTPKVCITAILLRLISFDCGQNGDKETQKKYHKNKLDAAKNSALCIWKKSAIEMHPWLPQPLPSPPLCSSKTKRQLKNRNRWMWDYKMVS